MKNITKLDDNTGTENNSRSNAITLFVGLLILGVLNTVGVHKDKLETTELRITGRYITPSKFTDILKPESFNSDGSNMHYYIGVYDESGKFDGKLIMVNKETYESLTGPTLIISYKYPLISAVGSYNIIDIKNG